MAAAQAAEVLSAATIGAALGSWFGFEPGLLGCAGIGAGAFVMFATSMPRMMALACMVFSVPFGSILAHAVGVAAFGSSVDGMRILAGLFGLALAPLARGLVRTLEKRSDSLMDSAVDQVADRLKPKGGEQ